MDALQKSAKDNILRLEQEWTQRQESAMEELDRQTALCERMRSDLARATEMLSDNQEMLKQEREECRLE
jgi:hypothetical protein